MSILNGASSNVPLFPKQAPTGLEGANGLVDQIAIDQTGESSLLTPPLDGADIPAGRDAPFDPYSYQIEMFEQSLHRNIIVAMDTGSGKTHIAVLRIRVVLEETSHDQIVWFMAPIVALCEQQHRVLERQFPAVGVKLLSSANNVDTWSDRAIWDTFLKNVRVVVSTPKILLDALTHAFVNPESLALLVFDEAHNCSGKDPGSTIMHDFYEPRKAQNLSIPKVLGLSASPIMNSKPQSLEKIEATLDAVCRTPTLHRSELLAHVNKPRLRLITFVKEVQLSGLTGSTRTLTSLTQIYETLDISQDPYIIHLRKEDSEKSRRKLEEALMKRKTWCQTQIRSFCNTSLFMRDELGPWAADYYIFHVIQKYLERGERDSESLWDSASEERCYLADTLRRVDTSQMLSGQGQMLEMISNKAAKFLNFISTDEVSTGIVFVQRRATVAVLAKMLATHPATGHLRIGTMVGASQYSQRAKSIGELIEVEDQRVTLERFRSGRLDFILATSVLEEGIDIPACNLVLCFDEPANLKSFVQRRGRARMKKSSLVILQDSQSDKLAEWESLEEEMKRIYADDMRQLKNLEEMEMLEEHDKRIFRVDQTGALLTLDNAVSHLYHFCAVLPAGLYVDRQPDFIFVEGERTKVILPLSVDDTVRVAYSRTIWASERNGRKDAAFEAYVALYRAGLVDDHLMPLLRREDIDESLVSAVEKRPALVQVHNVINPWVEVAQAWSSSMQPLARSMISLKDQQNNIIASVALVSPVRLPQIPNIQIYWDEVRRLNAEICNATYCDDGGNQTLAQAQELTRTTLKASFGHRFPIEPADVIVPFVASFNGDIVPMHLRDLPARSSSQIPDHMVENILITDIEAVGVPYVLEQTLDSKPNASLVKHPHKGYDTTPDNVPYFSLSRLTRREDFLHPIPLENQQPSTKPYSYVLPITRCRIVNIPFSQVQFGLLFPSIMHRIEIYLLAERLSQTLLSDVKYGDLSLIVMAISASNAGEATNYQRLEFLGDSVLKTCTSLQLLAEYPLWHEGYLSARKDRLVANSRLARAAIEVGLDKYILTKSFTGRKWRPLYVKDLLASNEINGSREMSSKVLADVVEALIGAAMIDGGFPKALACIRVFLPEITWQPLQDRRISLYDRVTAAISLPPTLEPLEQLIGYKFIKISLLLEAMTHASCHNAKASYERLEFFGDSLLDTLIVRTIFSHSPDLSHVRMHLLRTAFVNADFLAFICMDWAVPQESGSVIEPKAATSSQKDPWAPSKALTPIPVLSTKLLPLWAFLRHSNRKLADVQRSTAARYTKLAPRIRAALEDGDQYPWSLLTLLDAQKFYSDMIESLLGAVYIDSGDLEQCAAVLETMGVLRYLRRVLRATDADAFRIRHPKEELGILADTEKVKYVLGVEKGENSPAVAGGGDAGSAATAKEYTCEVWVGDRLVCVVGQGTKRDEAKVRAAEEACRILTAERKQKGKKATANWRGGGAGTAGGVEVEEGKADDDEEVEGGVLLNSDVHDNSNDDDSMDTT